MKVTTGATIHMIQMVDHWISIEIDLLDGMMLCLFSLINGFRLDVVSVIVQITVLNGDARIP